MDISKLKLFFALSRTQHLLLDMCAPALAALLWLGAFPPLKTVITGLITAFSGYATVYSLNDLIDYRTDRDKVQYGWSYAPGQDIDNVYVRHPVAQGLLSLKEGLIWTSTWAVLTLIGSFLLNPVCCLIFVLSAFLEIFYCLLLKVSYLRTLISGVVKTAGAIAAVFAVDSNPNISFMLLLFFWFFFWEIGGQNIPNDLVDMEEDKLLNAKTLPLELGSQASRIIIFISILITVALSVVISLVIPERPGLFFLTGILFAGILTLLMPAFRLLKTKSPDHSAALFNKASFYPLTVLVIVIIFIVL